MDRVAILKIEPPFAREPQEQLPALADREVDKAMVSTFLHSQPQGLTTPASPETRGSAVGILYSAGSSNVQPLG